jgi:vacuolar-type H+-ATPase subunit E/Vma4
MSAEIIIAQIKKDAQREIQKINKDAEQQIKNILLGAKETATYEAQKILENGTKEAEIHKKILISKELQIQKRAFMNARENIIDECFVKAQHELSVLPEHAYTELVTTLMKEGCSKLGTKCSVLISREFDKSIAQKFNIPVSGHIEAAGGIIFKSHDGQITLDNTFDGILKREKETIRNIVGKLLFSDQME